jgi:hypothetical protein
MNPTRRGFIKISGAALLLSTGGAGVLIEGCNAGTVFQDITAWLPTAEMAFAGIVTLLTPFLPPGATVLIGEVNAAFQVVAAAVTEYENAPAADKATLLGKIRVALAATSDQIQAFLNAVNIPGNPLIAVALGLAQILISAIEGFLNKIPAPAGAKVHLARTSIHCSGVTVVVVPKVRTLSAFKAAYNQVADTNGHPEIELK